MTQTILIGDVRDQLATLPDCSVQCVITSPPYWGLRDYGVAGQIGSESTFEEYIQTMVDLFGIHDTSDGGPEIHRRCTPAPSGSGPEGETCRTCEHAVRVRHNGRAWWKCGKMKHAWSHGPGTDIRLKWDACREWEASVT